MKTELCVPLVAIKKLYEFYIVAVLQEFTTRKGYYTEYILPIFVSFFLLIPLFSPIHMQIKEYGELPYIYSTFPDSRSFNNRFY